MRTDRVQCPMRFDEMQVALNRIFCTSTYFAQCIPVVTARL
jgi:hypothetical protein